MAITQGYIGYYFDADFLAWITEKLVPDYVDSIEPNAAETEYSLIKDGKTIAKLNSSRWELYPNGTGSGYSVCNTSTNSRTYGYTCKNGVAIQHCGDGGAYTTRQGVIIFTKDNHGDTIIVSSTRLSDTSSSRTTLSLCTSAYIAHYEDIAANAVTSLSAAFNSGNAMCMTPFAFSAVDGSEMIFTPNVFWCSMYQHSGTTTLVINGVRYISFGPWIIKDE